MTVGNALKFTCLGITGGLVLRLLTMLYFYDYETGFFTDSGMLSWITIIFIAVIWLVSMFFCIKDKRYFYEGYVVRRNIFAGLISFLSSVMLTIMVVNQYESYQLNKTLNTALSNGGVIHLVFIIISVLMVILHLAIAISFFSGVNFFNNIPAVHLISVFWGIFNVLFTFLFYAKSALTTENIYMVVGNVTLLFSLLYISKLIVGFGDDKTAKRLYIVGIPAVMLNITYNLSNLVLNLLGREYMDRGEVPFIIQTANLCIALYILAFLFTFKKYGLRLKTQDMMEKEKGRHNG